MTPAAHSKAAQIAAARARLYGSDSRDLAHDLAAGASRMATMAGELRTDVAGALDRADRIADQAMGLHRAALRLRERLLAERSTPPRAA